MVNKKKKLTKADKAELSRIMESAAGILIAAFQKYDLDSHMRMSYQDFAGNKFTLFLMKHGKEQ